jgi:transcriptional regulatory protein AMDR
LPGRRKTRIHTLTASRRFTVKWRRLDGRRSEVSKTPEESSVDTVPSAPSFDRLGDPVPFTDLSAALDSGREVSRSPCYTQDSLSQFFHKGVWSSAWAEFDDYERLRLAYIGTPASNFAHLVNLNQRGQRFLTYPHPRIHPHLPWKPNPQNYLNKAPSLDSVRQLSSFPAKEIRDELVEAFFEKIHPYFPVLDEASFRVGYNDPTNPPPLILFQAVLLAGAHVCNHPKVVDSRQSVKSILYHRTKLLFDMRYENNRLYLVQAALLLTWYLEDADSVSLNSYYWVGVACRIGFGIGLHRNMLNDPNTPDRMPFSDRRLYRRVWWVLYQVEVMSALEHGRPSMIHRDDFDQPPLEPNDFCEVNGQINQKVDFEYCSKNIELCDMILDILRATSPGAILRGECPDLESLNASLVKWAISVPPGNNFPSLQLQLHYQTVILHLHRLFLDGVDRMAMSPDSGDQCNAAAQAILSIFEALIRLGVLQQCYFPSVMALIAAGVNISRGIERLVDRGSKLLSLNAIRNLETVVQAAGLLKQSWPNAEGVEKLFRILVDRYKDCLHREQYSQDAPATTDFCNFDWEAMLLFDPQPGLPDLDWMDAGPHQ